MKKNTLKMLLHWLVSTVLCFVLIYLFVFFGGWRLLETGDPILPEVVAAIAMGFVLWLVYEITSAQDAKIGALEKRIAELEKSISCAEEVNK